MSLALARICSATEARPAAVCGARQVVAALARANMRAARLTCDDAATVIEKGETVLEVLP